MSERHHLAQDLGGARATTPRERDAICKLHRAGWPVDELTMVFQVNSHTIRRVLRRRDVGLDGSRRTRSGIEHPLEQRALTDLALDGWTPGELSLAFGIEKDRVIEIVNGPGVAAHG